jgi:hypothetical protein
VSRPTPRLCALLFTVFVIALYGRTVSGQNQISGAIQGEALDAKTRAPIVGARVVAQDPNTGLKKYARTSADGHWIIYNVPPGIYTLHCYHDDYTAPPFPGVNANINSIKTITIPPFLMEKTELPIQQAELRTPKTERKGRMPKPSTAAEPPVAPEPSPPKEPEEPAAQLPPPPAPQQPEPQPPSPPAPPKPEPQQPPSPPAPPQPEPQPPVPPAPQKPEPKPPVPPAPPAEPLPEPQLAAQPVGSSAEPDAALMVNATNAMRGGNFNEYQLQALPLPGIRTFDSLALLVPGVAEAPQTLSTVAGPGIGAGLGTAGQFSVNGMRGRANSFMMDGSDNNDQDVAVRRQGYLSLAPQSIESVQEFQISTMLWDAEQGRNVGSQVNVVSSSGSNALHGQAYGYFTDSRLNARNFFEVAPQSRRSKDPFTRIQAGFDLSGPIVRDRTHFFAGFEHQSLNAAVTQHFASPTQPERLFQNSENLLIIGTSSSYDYNYIAFGRQTPLGQNLLATSSTSAGHVFYPLPNNPGGPYGVNTLTQILPASGSGNIFSTKLTHQIGEKTQLAARYSFSDDKRVLPSVHKAISSSVNSDSRNQNVSVILDNSFSDTFVNQARVSYGRTRLDFSELAGNPMVLNSSQEDNFIWVFPKNGDDDYFDLVTSKTYPLGQLVIRPFSPVGLDSRLFPQNRTNNTYQFADSLSKTWQKHTLKFGADIRYVQMDSRQDSYYRPYMEVNNGILIDLNTEEIRSMPGVEFASIGQISSILQTITRDAPDSEIGLRFAEFNFFINGNFRLNPRLTLDYGVRYELNTVPSEANNRIESALDQSNMPAATTSPFLCGTGNVCDAFLSAYANAVAEYNKILGGRKKIYESDRNNFGPHIGIAFSPTKDGKTAIRAGYGIYYDTILGAVVSQSRNVFPNEIPLLSDSVFYGSDGITTNSPAAFYWWGDPNYPILVRPDPSRPDNPSNQLSGDPEDFATMAGALFYQGQAGGLSFTLPEKNLRTPYVQQWHLSIDREFGGYMISASYAGTKGNKLTRLVAPNGGWSITPYQALLTIDFYDTIYFNDDQQLDLGRKNPFLGAYRIYENSARSSYHALQLEARKRLSDGLMFSGAYTWSHAIDDASDITDIAGASALAQDFDNLRAERADANFDVRHRFAGSFIYDLPLLRGRNDALAAVFGGWRLSSIFMARSGQPFTLQVPFDANLDGNLNDRPSTVEGLAFHDSHGQTRITQAAVTESFFDLLNPANGRVGRNTVRADGLINWDLALNKRFSFTETSHLDFRAEFFNITNRTNFGIPVRTIGDPGFGQSTDTATPARCIQFALKLAF